MTKGVRNPFKPDPIEVPIVWNYDYSRAIGDVELTEEAAALVISMRDIICLVPITVEDAEGTRLTGFSVLPIAAVRAGV